MVKLLPNTINYASISQTSVKSVSNRKNLLLKSYILLGLIGVCALGFGQNLDGLTKRDPLVLSGSVSSGTSFYK